MKKKAAAAPLKKAQVKVQPSPSKRRTPSKKQQSSSGGSDSDDEVIVAPKKKAAARVAPAAAAKPRSAAKPAPRKDEVRWLLFSLLSVFLLHVLRFVFVALGLMMLQFKIESDSSASPPRAAPKAKAARPKAAAGSSSDDDEIIVKPKMKLEAKAAAAGDDSDDALLSIIYSSKNIESDDEAKPRAYVSAAAAKAKSATLSLAAGDNDDARLHPALHALPEDLSKRAARSSLPLTAAPALKLQHVLVQCDEDCADLAGDSGVIGRFKYSDGRMLLDLKGYMCARAS